MTVWGLSPMSSRLELLDCRPLPQQDLLGSRSVRSLEQRSGALILKANPAALFQEVPFQLKPCHSLFSYYIVFYAGCACMAIAYP